MKRIWTIRSTPRILLATLAVAFGLIVFSYARTRASHSGDELNSNGEGKCEGSKTQSQFVLWETLTHNLLISKR